jgi:hypothetical protein
MDDSFHDLETELKLLKPRQPSHQLLKRLAADLPSAPVAAPARPRYTTATNLSSWKWLGWRAAGLAATVALVATAALLTWPRRPVPVGDSSPRQLAANAPVKSADRYRPVAATNVLYDLKDEGLVKAEDNSDARRVRYRYLDTYTWKNPKSNASLKWSVPRDEIRLVSATLN